MKIINTLRFTVIFFFVFLALWALWLDFSYGNNAWVISNSDFGKFFAKALINLAPELAGIVIGVVSIDYLNEKRQEEQLRAQLIRQMKSSHADIADPAINELRHYGWLTNGSLNFLDFSYADFTNAVLDGAKLEKAYMDCAKFNSASLIRINLRGAKLRYTKMKSATMWEANLVDAILTMSDMGKVDLFQANLQGALLLEANMQNARIHGTNLQHADLTKTNLSGASIYGANFEGANFQDTNLQGACLLDANLREVKNCTLKQFQMVSQLEGVIMPDGTRIKAEIGSPNQTLDDAGLSFTEWLDGQRLLPLDQRVIIIDDEKVDSETKPKRTRKA